jgi:DNA-directed RNA polymerase specialized sigma subunit
MRRLTKQERIVLTPKYFEELKLVEIGAVLEWTESPSSQLDPGALRKLHAQMVLSVDGDDPLHRVAYS